MCEVKGHEVQLNTLAALWNNNLNGQLQNYHMSILAIIYYLPDNCSIWTNIIPPKVKGSWVNFLPWKFGQKSSEENYKVVKNLY